LFSIDRMVARYLETYGIATPAMSVVAAAEDFGPRKQVTSGAAGRI
jgi:hypothetical protein